MNGEIDIAVAGMTMTSEREEVVDFVAPYFDQSGISIIIRKPVRPRSLFKFMEVLKVEVLYILVLSHNCDCIYLVLCFLGLVGHISSTCGHSSNVVVLGSIFSIFGSEQQSSSSLSMQDFYIKSNFIST